MVARQWFVRHLLLHLCCSSYRFHCQHHHCHQGAEPSALYQSILFFEDKLEFMGRLFSFMFCLARLCTEAHMLLARSLGYMLCKQK